MGDGAGGGVTGCKTGWRVGGGKDGFLFGFFSIRFCWFVFSVPRNSRRDGGSQLQSSSTEQGVEPLPFEQNPLPVAVGDRLGGEVGAHVPPHSQAPSGKNWSHCPL